MMKKYFTMTSKAYPFNKKNGFTLIELLIVIAIIGILTAISTFGLSQARQAARDGRRKSDLEYIRSGVETYRADCGTYPITSGTLNSPLVGNGTTCSSSNTYITSVPTDPTSGRLYAYWSDPKGVKYVVCASLENGSGADGVCTGLSCGSGFTCNYHVTNP